MSVSITFDRCELRAATRELLIDGVPAVLGARAFDVLVALIDRRDRVVSKNELLEVVWPGLVVEENNLSVQVSTLRRLLGTRAIATVPGRGYRFAAVLAGSGSSAKPADSPSTAKPDSPSARQQAPADVAGSLPGNLPAALPVLIGRENDLAALEGQVRGERLVSVVGAGGIGKTRLAHAVAHAVRDAFPDGVWIVELGSIASAELLPGAITHALGATLREGRSAADEVIEALRARALLLVLDNCEHLVGAVCEFAEAALQQAPHIHLLVTSQELLRASGERLFRIAPLAVPDTASLTAARGTGAVDLFVERVVSSLPGFALDDSNVADVVDLCRRLDGLPLAIELAAARVPMLGVAGVRQRLDERLRVLSAGARSAPRRHQTLRELLDWSHSLLGDAERVVFRRVGVFAGSFSLAAAQHALTDGALDEWALLEHLAVLVDKSLLAVEPVEPPRYRLLESARTYALEKLRESGELDMLRARHAQAIRAMFEQDYAARWQLPTQVRFARWRADMDNLRAALEWAQHAGDAEMQMTLMSLTGYLFGNGGLRREGTARCEQALKLVDERTPALLEARLCLAFAECTHPRTEWIDQVTRRRAVELFRSQPDDEGRAGLFEALFRTGYRLALTGNFAACDAINAEMASLLDPRWGAMGRWHVLASVVLSEFHRGQIGMVAARGDEMLRVAEETGDRIKILTTLVYLEQAMQGTGRFAEAVEFGRRLVADVRRDPFSGRPNVVIGNLAMALVETGQLDEAIPLAREAMAGEMQQDTLWSVLDLYARIALVRGHPRLAARVLGRSDAGHRGSEGRREFNEQRQHDIVLSAVARLLPPAELEQLLAEGAQLSDERAAQMALEGTG